MKKESSKGLRWRDKVRETVIGKLVDKSFDAVLWIGAAVIGIPTVVRWFTRSAVTTPVWVLVALCTAIVGLAVVAVLLWRQLRRVNEPPKPSTPAVFEPFPVEDHKLHMGWRVKTEPRHWIDTDLSLLSRNYMQHIVDGPFHIRAECHERLSVRDTSGLGDSGPGPMLNQRCPGCGEIVFEPSAPPWLWDIRGETALELQRLHRLGGSIAAPKVVLENPRYWDYLEPPAPK
jgi:hypothetical protein